MVYMTTQLDVQLHKTPPKSCGITIKQRVYDSSGKLVTHYKKGGIYQVELLLDTDLEVPYGVIDVPAAAGFQLLREDFRTTRTLKEFNTDHAEEYPYLWASSVHSLDRAVYYTYRLYKKSRLVYFIKALYEGEFTWLPTVVQGMYHPQYFGRTGTVKIKIIKELRG
jgi:uncharacterized protein YfaS (alpha-2-macroglobulin family)